MKKSFIFVFVLLFMFVLVKTPIRTLAATLKIESDGIKVDCNSTNFDLEVSSSNEKISINTFERRLTWNEIFWGNIPYGKEYQVTLKADGETIRVPNVRIGEVSSSARVTPRNYSNYWQLENNRWFYYGSSGQRLIGWLQYNGAWYYLLPEKTGEMCTDTWRKIEGEWYAFNQDGRMKAQEWVESNKKWFYVGPSGWILKNQFVGPYHVNESGVWDYTLAPQ